MNFSTLEFFNFLLAFLTLFFIFKKFISQRLMLLVGSWSFYALWNPIFLLLLITSTLVDFFIGKKLEIQKEKSKKISLICLSLGFNLGALIFFKYARFAIGVFDDLFNLGLPLPDIILPMGISFYTFQTLSYTLDIYRGRLKAHRSFTDFALFVSFFPQLVAGPIVRAAHFLPQIKKHISFSYENTAYAIERFTWGLAKKLLIADHIGKTVDLIYTNPDLYSGRQISFAALFFSVQLYVDFSAYSDMAIALSRFFGFHIPENFNNPYFSKNIQEFWRRWHISLSTWLKDYLYIPLGGNRGSSLSVMRNLMITMTLGGLWHGAAWGFVIWGVFHGLLLIIFKILKKISLPSIINQLITFACVCYGFTIFRAQSFEKVELITSKLLLFFTGQGMTSQHWVSLKLGCFLTGLVFIGCFFFHFRWHRFWFCLPYYLRALGIVILLWLTITLCPHEDRPFYYFIF